MNASFGQQSCTPADLRNAVTEVLQSQEFCNQLRCSIERVSSNNLLRSNSVPTPRIPVSTPADELRRLFPSIRSSSSNGRAFRSTSMGPGINNTTENRKKRKRGAFIIASFKRDVILIRSPDVTKTLTGLQKSFAYESGYAVSAATFQKEWTEGDIYEYIENLFADKLLGKKFEILIPVGGTLVKPNLSQDTAFDGNVMCRLFNQKVVYVRPLSEIMQDCVASTESNSADDGKLNQELEMTVSDNQDLYVTNNHETYEVVDNSEIVDEQGLLNNVPKLENIYSVIEVSNDNEQDITLQILEDDVKTAMVLSLEEEKSKNTLTMVLQGLYTSIDTDKISQFNIYRDDVFNCCLRGVRRRNFSPLHKISVLFTDIDDVSEGAVDMGGPTREMFTLVLKYLQNSMLFEGPEHVRNVTMSHYHVQSRHYYEAGRLIALSLIHGGPSPQFFSKTLFHYLISGVEGVRPSLEEVMDIEIRKELENIRDASNVTALQEIILNSTYMAIAGFDNVNCSFDKKDDILQSAIKYYVIYRAMPALEQFREGLNTLGLIDKLKMFKEDFQQLLCYSHFKLTAQKVSSTFTVKFSEMGSNRRTIESRILSFWEDYLLDCEERESDATLEDILRFATGCNKIPPLGFEKNPQLEFLHDEEFFWPKGNTCALTLLLPISYKSNEYEKFRKNMDYGILNGMQFGFA